ncbi:LuxR C-terminal-related transcriptional regulator [Arthrobacter hankyongi]|nr:LuxR C-terminal-related transcriptional regulator [Arthrobacter hankyongi]
MRGRGVEADEVLALLESARLVTVTGPAGVGKTVLARRVLSRAGGTEQDWFTPDGVPGDALRERIGVRLDAQGAGARPLIVLDTAPGDAAVPALVSALLDDRPALRILATSRGRLALPTERQFCLRPFDVPELPRHGMPDDEWFERAPAVALYLDRAASAARSLTPDRETCAAAIAVCRRLGGLPLAIHLAALRANVLSAEAQLRELERPLDFLTVRGPASADPEGSSRHSSLRRSLEAGLDGLPAGALEVLSVLARFPEGCSLRTLRCAQLPGGGDPLDELSVLADAALVTPEAEPAGGTRFRTDLFYQELFREAAASERVCAAVQRIRQAVLARCSTAAAARGPAWEEASRWFTAEYGNLLEHFADCLRRQDIVEAIGIVDLLCRFWVHSGRIEEGIHTVEALGEPDGLDFPARAKLAGTRGRLLAHHASYTSAYSDLADAVAFWRQAGDAPRIAEALAAFAAAALEVDGWPAARQAAEEAVRLFRGLGDEWSVARTLGQLGAFAADVPGEEEFARRCLESSAADLQTLGDAGAASLPLEQLGRLLLDDGNYQQAQLVLEHGLREMRTVADHFRVSAHLNLLALVDMASGRATDATGRYFESLQLTVELGLKGRAVWCLEGLHDSLTALGCTEAAAAAAACAVSLREELDLHDWVEACSPKRSTAHGGPDLPRAVRMVLTGRTVWPPAAVLDQVPAVLSGLAEAAAAEEAPIRSGPRPDGLTPREIEILGLIGSGMTSRAIAARLVISIDTVGRHITNLYRKIGARGRADATAYALHMGLVPEPTGGPRP